MVRCGGKEKRWWRRSCPRAGRTAARLALRPAPEACCLGARLRRHAALEPRCSLRPVACQAPDACRVGARRRRRRFRQGGKEEQEIEEAVNLFSIDGSDSVDSKDLTVTFLPYWLKGKVCYVPRAAQPTLPV